MADDTRVSPFRSKYFSLPSGSRDFTKVEMDGARDGLTNDVHGIRETENLISDTNLIANKMAASEGRPTSYMKWIIRINLAVVVLLLAMLVLQVKFKWPPVMLTGAAYLFAIVFAVSVLILIAGGIWELYKSWKAGWNRTTVLFAHCADRVEWYCVDRLSGKEFLVDQLAYVKERCRAHRADYLRMLAISAGAFLLAVNPIVSATVPHLVDTTHGVTFDLLSREFQAALAATAILAAIAVFMHLPISQLDRAIYLTSLAIDRKKQSGAKATHEESEEEE